MLAAFPIIAKGFQPVVKIPMRFEDHAKVFRATLEEEFEGCHPVQKNAVENRAMDTLCWKVLHQQR